MKKILVLYFLLFSTTLIYAQYTEIINSKRPGFSESPYGVGTNIYQFETGFFYQNNASNNTNPILKTIGGNLFFRVGKLNEKLEFNAQIAYAKQNIYDYGDINHHINPLEEFNNSLAKSTKNISGIQQLTVGAKYLLYEQKYTDKSKEIRSWKRKMAFDKKRLIPSIGVYAGINTNFLGKDFKDKSISYKAAILLQNDFSERLVVLTNLIANNITSDLNNYAYIITMTYAINKKWSYFIENEGIYSKLGSPNYNFGVGGAYLYSNNLQFDASIRSNLLNNYGNMYLSFGASYRLDKHKDKLKEDKTKKILNKKSYKKRKKLRRKRSGSIFSRIFKKH
ncbi:MAG: transporter [Lutibacter sp.]